MITRTLAISACPLSGPYACVIRLSLDRKRNFLDAVPHLLDDVQAIDRELGREPRRNWSAFARLMTDLLKQRGSRWRVGERKLFPGGLYRP